MERVTFKQKLASKMTELSARFFSPYTKRQIVVSSAVRYFGDVDMFDDDNIKRINQLMHICNHNYTSMKLPMIFSERIWKQTSRDLVLSSQLSLTTLTEKLYKALPIWLRYKDVKHDLREVILHLRNNEGVFA